MTDAEAVAELLETLRRYHERCQRGWRWWSHEEAEMRRLGRVCTYSNATPPMAQEIIANMESLMHLLPRKP